jgi:hypothetical protein
MLSRSREAELGRRCARRNGKLHDRIPPGNHIDCGDLGTAGAHDVAPSRATEAQLRRVRLRIVAFHAERDVRQRFVQHNRPSAREAVILEYEMQPASVEQRVEATLHTIFRYDLE